MNGIVNRPPTAAWLIWAFALPAACGFFMVCCLWMGISIDAGGYLLYTATLVSMGMCVCYAICWTPTLWRRVCVTGVLCTMVLAECVFILVLVGIIAMTRHGLAGTQ